MTKDEIIGLEDRYGSGLYAKRALVRVVRGKGGRRETDFVRLFNGHRQLRRALLKLAATEYDPPSD